MSASAIFVHRRPSIRPPRASVRQQRTCSIPLGRVGQVAGARSTPEYGIRLFRAATAGMAVDSWLSGTGSWPRRPQAVGSRVSSLSGERSWSRRLQTVSSRVSSLSGARIWSRRPQAVGSRVSSLSGGGIWSRRPQAVGSRDAIADDPDTGTNALCGGARRSRHPDVVRTPSSELRRLHTSRPMTSSSDSDPDVVRTVVGVAQRRRVHIRTRSY